MLEELKESVCRANLDLVSKGLVIYTWGNVSGIDRDSDLMVIKPSGVDYAKMSAEDMVVVDLKSGQKVEGRWNPSSDTNTHIILCLEFHDLGGITHTHSVNAVAFAQAGISIPALGTTHADYFYGAIPCTRELTEQEVMEAYETNTGKVISECIKNEGHSPLEMPGILVKNHGPFAFGEDAASSVFNAVVIETVAEMALKTLELNSKTRLPQYILDKHYFRKHGENAYYGQKR